MWTPWGESDSQKEIADGIIGVETPSHGGYKVSSFRLAEMPAPYRIIGGWYEEDCDWCLVVLSFPQYFTSEEIDSATRCARNWHPDEWEKVTGMKIQPGESYLRDHFIGVR